MDTFESFDLNGDGTIDLSELQLGLSKGKEKDVSSATALEVLLKKFDANENGVLEREEFVALMESPELEEFYERENAEANEDKGQALNLEQMYNLTPTPEETPALVQEKLAQFDLLIDKVDSKKKSSYIAAQESCPDRCGDDFKLAFLRCEVFNVKPAVDRWIRYWNMRLVVFGKEKAFLPMTLEGTMKGCEKAVSSNYVAVAKGTTDPDGRALVLIDFSKEGGDDSSEDLLRVMWYQMHVALSSESAQKKGVVFYLKTIERMSDGRASLWKKLADAVRGTLPVRVSAMHFISCPAFMKFLLQIAKTILGKKLRNRIYVHSGSVDEKLESLSKFGLGTMDKLPDVVGGNLSFSAGDN